MNGWKYVGKGERVSYGVPTRDISAEEFGRLNPLDQRHVEQSDLYKKVASSAPTAKPKGDGGEAK